MPRIEGLIPLALSAIRSNVTERYSVIAASEGPGTDHKEYLHVWPRDSFFVALELKNFNPGMAERIVESILNLSTDNGLFYQRYELDGSPDPRAWCNGDGSRQLDQDALRFVAVSKFPSLKLDLEKLKESYLSFFEAGEGKKAGHRRVGAEEGLFLLHHCCIDLGSGLRGKGYSRIKKPT